jgi:hypothetical protein
MSIATILLIPTSEFIALYGVWLVGALGVAGLMVMLMIRLRVLGPGEE